MSYIKFSPDLFIGQQELNRFQSFMQNKQNILIQQRTATWGILKGAGNVIDNNFLVQPGTNSGTIKIPQLSYALDSNVNLITKSIQDNIPIVAGGWYWIMVSYSTSNIETGTVTIDASGNLTGIGTNFTDVLRGIPDFPSKIKFTNSTFNTGEFEIVNIINDTTALLAGTFYPESNLAYSIVGTFTPGVVIDDLNKYPFNYDGCTLTAVSEAVLNTAPTKIEGLQFYIARVQNIAGTVTVQDKRTEVYTTIY